MAKKAKVVENAPAAINIALLQALASGSVMRVGYEESQPLLNHVPPLIEVNGEDIVEGKAAARLTQDGFNMIGSEQHTEAAPVLNGAGSNYEIISGAALPAAKRGGRGGGAPIQYPFDKLEVGQTFFVPVSAKHPNPVKTLGSTVSSANMRYSIETGEMKTVERTKRGEKNKAIVDAQGNKVRETVQVPVRQQTRKFSIRPVKAGEVYGSWTAQANGALIGRVL